MILSKEMQRYSESEDKSNFNFLLLQECSEVFLRLLAPYAPHLAEELWERTEHEDSIFLSPWPLCNDEAKKRDRIEVIIQIDGKKRGKMPISKDQDRHEVIESAKNLPQTKRILSNKRIEKVICIDERIVNFVLDKERNTSCE